jgi:hypothetical protein
MNAFDPENELKTQADADAYVGWCADQFLRVANGGTYTYRTAIRASAWLFVCATAQLHLDDEVEEQRDELQQQLAITQKLARQMERQHVKMQIERLVIMRSSLDCWEPVGRFASVLLDGARMGISARLLIELHPLVDLWALECPDVWALLHQAESALEVIEAPLELEDYAVRPNADVVAKFTWQHLFAWARHKGIPPLSAN